MNKSQLAKKVAVKLDVPQVLSKKIIQLCFDEIIEALSQGENVTLTGFGRITAKKTPARTRRNPKTGEKVHVPENVSIRFKASRRAKEKLLEIFEHRSDG
ncbi:HU family DNA-binding protein [candidate division CSSED10-310 bacterium]|uniref:HU family DNA-binding protein n=1 Tax=candidate division CSSED10-310 bacterium TaxID=2855610 RepID=A0ABV6Z4F3_UNCC1